MRYSLKSLIKECGFTMQYLAEELNMTRTCFTNKVHGWSQFSPNEFAMLSQVLQMNPRVLRRALPQRRKSNGAGLPE